MTPHEEVAALLRRALAGEVAAGEVADKNWWATQETWVSIGGWRIFFFIEADLIYDIYNAYAPDGRKFEFMPADGSSSINRFLTDEEAERLCLLLGRQSR